MLAIFTFFNVLLYFSNAHLYFFDARLTSFKPLYWYFITIAVGGLLLVFHQGARIPRPASMRLIGWALLFMAMAAVSFVLMTGTSRVAMQVLITACEAMALLVMFSLFLQDERSARVAAYAVFLVVVFSVVMNYVDFANLFGGAVHLSIVHGRAAGLYENPNISGQALAMGMVLSASLVPKRLRWLFCLFVATGVVLTFSRGAIILWMIAVLGLAWADMFVLRRMTSVAVMGLLVIALTAALTAGGWVGAFRAAGLGSYLDADTSSRIGQSFLDQRDYSSRARLAVAQRGLELFLERPFFGWGIGSTQDLYSGVSTHDMFILLGAEYGIIGVLIFCALIWVLWRAHTEHSGLIALLYGVAGLFSHNNLEASSVMVVLALAVGGWGLRGKGGDGDGSGRPGPKILGEDWHAGT
ncbi:MAG: O-antigen ligase family protein [Nitrospiraceae bacterium]|nr:O-antigen ligase family protein [Nitrospiraceae bacterium]